MPSSYNSLLVGSQDPTAIDYASSAPSGGNEGDVKVRIDKPLIGTVQQRVSGVWTSLSNSYTWAGRPAAASYTGAVITITDWNQDFFSDGVNWIPISKRLTVLISMTETADTVGVGPSLSTYVSDVIPAGLIIAGCKIIFEALYKFTGTTAVKNPRITNQGVNIYSLGGSSASHLSAEVRGALWVVNPTSLTRVGDNSRDASSFYQSGVAVQETTIWDWTTAQTIDWRAVVTSPDTGRISARSIEVIYP